MLQITDKSIRDENQSIQTKNQDVSGGADGANRVDESNKNPSNNKKWKNQSRFKKSTVTKDNSSRTDVLNFGAKETFIHLWKAFTKTSIFRYFDPKCHIQIKTYFLWYAIGKVLS